MTFRLDSVLPRSLPILPLLLAILVALTPSGLVFAADWTVLDDSEWCDDEGSSADFCEVREITLSDRDLIAVDSGGNGGIRVEGWDRDEIRLRVRVHIWRADDDAEAEELASKVMIETDSLITADGPRSRRNGPNWSTSFRLMVPRSSDLDLDTSNGGISIQSIHGEIRAKTSNGGLAFHEVNGDVRGRTTNGGIDVSVKGDGWNGDGLDLRTTNGGIHLAIPEDYSADLEASTVNGRVRSDLPLSSRQVRRGRVRATLGDGGPTIRLETSNGGIRIRED